MKLSPDKISILVSTYNWKEALSLCISAILKQTILPKEVVIADDGSRSDTSDLIKHLQETSPIPLIHVWHEDQGFRKTVILNKAITKITGEYIIQLDGDVVPSRHFIADHLDIAEPGFFVCGSRVRLTDEVSKKAFSKGYLRTSIFSLPLGYALNSLRSRILRHYMAERYAKKIDHLRGCNMAFWKSDLILVNGYNEDLLQWGHEDGELAFRLYYAGIRKKALKMGGVVYHLYHKEESRTNEGRHLEELEKVKEKHLTWCANGINKYLNV